MCKMCVNEKRRMRSALFGLGVSILDFHFAAEAYLAPMGLVHFQRFWAGLWKMDRDFAPPLRRYKRGGTAGFPAGMWKFCKNLFFFTFIRYNRGHVRIKFSRLRAGLRRNL